MDIIIIEDEPLLASELESDLTNIDASINVLAKLTSIQDSILWLHDNTCDLIFSDIELSDGISFTIFAEVKTQIPIIFTTAYNQYAIKAFELNSVGYLLKPFDRDDLIKVLEKYKTLNVDTLQLQNLIYRLNTTDNSPTYLNRIILSLGNTQKPVSVQNVAFFMADDRYLFAITDHSKKYYYNSTLAKLEKELDPTQFFRVSRRYFINKAFIKEIITISNNRLEIKLNIKTEEKLILSYSRNNDFKKWIVS